MAAGAERAAKPQGSVKFFLADPELGVAGVYSVNGTELYFEARRALDATTGAPGALSLRVIDGEARTVALGGEPFAKQWEPQQGEFTKSEGFAYARLLSDLGGALESADLHVSLSGEKSALADLAMQASGTPAGRFPLRAEVDARQYSAPAASQVADFYLRSARGVELARERDGGLEANLGNGILLRSLQQVIAEEAGANVPGRIEGYSMVTAADGYVLGAELGGDLLPKGWSEAMDIDNARDHHALATDFGHAATRLNALAYSGRATQGVTTLGYQSEQAALQRMAQSLATNLLPEIGNRNELSDVRAQAGGRYQTYIQVWRKPFVIIAEHSGTRVGKWLYSSATSTTRTHQGWIRYCNHGTCPATENMTHKCTFTGPRLTAYRRPYTLADAGFHTCSTPYWALKSNGKHNCHDDSSVQVRAIRGQAYSHNTGRCKDTISFAWAPSCGVQ